MKSISEEILNRSREYLLDNYGRLDLCMVRGEESYIWDSEGKRYLDLFVGFGAGGIAGHCNPEIVSAINAQAQELLSHGNLFTNMPQVEVAAELIRNCFPGKVFLCHSGAEANEAALKLARKASGEGRYKIISFENSFHGRTMGSLSLTPSSFQKGFEPMLDGNIMLPFGDLPALESSIDELTAGIILEPIQGEGGINIPTVEFMQGVRQLCDKHSLLMICDEVWSAPARTGRYFAYQHFDVIPDVITVAKALGGGLPLAACIVSESYADVLGPGSHGCTLGGNPLCSAAALAALRMIEKRQLCKQASDKGEMALSILTEANCSSVSSVRGKGLMIGIELCDSVSASEVVEECREAGLIVCSAKNNVIRIAPALTIREDILRNGLKSLIEILRQY
jgi:predicted acetylornithine/succinylornithine family transaminase